MEDGKKVDAMSTKSCPECEHKDEQLSRLNRVTQRCQSCSTCHSPDSLKATPLPEEVNKATHGTDPSHEQEAPLGTYGKTGTPVDCDVNTCQQVAPGGAAASVRPGSSGQPPGSVTQSDAVLHKQPDRQYRLDDSLLDATSSSLHENQQPNPEDVLVKRGCSPKSSKPQGEPRIRSPQHGEVDKGSTGSQFHRIGGSQGKDTEHRTGAIPTKEEIKQHLLECQESLNIKGDARSSSPFGHRHSPVKSEPVPSPKSSPRSYRHYSTEKHTRAKTRHVPRKSSSPRHHERADPDMTLSSDLQSHPITQPTDQPYHHDQGMLHSEHQGPDQEASFSSIVSQLHGLQKQFKQLSETKTVLESDLIKWQQKYHSVTKELHQENKQLRDEIEALQQNERDAAERRVAETRQLMALSMQSDLSESKEFVHVERQFTKNKDNEDSLLMSLKQLDEKDRLLEKYKTHMQKLAAANQSWYEQHQQTEKEHQEQVSALQEKLEELKLQLQNLEKELHQEKEQRSMFEKLYQSSRDQLETGPQQWKDRVERAEKELAGTNRELRAAKEQLVGLVEERDRLNQENRKLQTAAWLKDSVPMFEGEPSPTEQQLQTQKEAFRHQAITWKEDFERERKDRTRAQAEKEHYKKKVESLQIEIQNLNYQIDSLTRDLQNLRSRNLDLEKKLYQPTRSSTAPAYPPPIYTPATSEPHAPPELNILEYPSDQPQRWNCRKCTYSNIPERSSCELCGSSRESRRAHTAPQAPATGAAGVTFPHYRLSRDVVPDHTYMRH